MAAGETDIRRNFEGFQNVEREIGESMYQRRVILLVSMINELVDKLGKLEMKTSDLEAKNLKIKKRHDDLANLFHLKIREVGQLEKRTSDLEEDNLQLRKKHEELASKI